MPVLVTRRLGGSIGLPICLSPLFRRVIEYLFHCLPTVGSGRFGELFWSYFSLILDLFWSQNTSEIVLKHTLNSPGILPGNLLNIVTKYPPDMLPSIPKLSGIGSAWAGRVPFLPARVLECRHLPPFAFAGISALRHLPPGGCGESIVMDVIEG